jgi:nucleoside-diphosphate-sugar epimerase
MNLVIGNTSQLSYYFPDNGFEKVSSRFIKFDDLKKKSYDRIFVTFSEQRTFLNENEKFYSDTNVHQTLDVIEKLQDSCNKIIVYSTSELWNNCVGPVDEITPYNFNYTPYIKSKEILCNTINENREKYYNTIIIYPFNFNSPHRKEGFLFSKIFQALIKEEQQIVGDLNMNRDLIHPSVITEISQKTNEDILVGCGELINIRDFVKTIFSNLKLSYDNLILEKKENNLPNKRKEYYSLTKFSSYNYLIEKTLEDVKKNKFS